MKALSKKGFTLVEIMIVVVIIGLLAALAIPAFKKVRNTAVEKTLFNDARQISSACNQYFSENASNSVTFGGIVGSNNYISGLSSGTLVAQEGGAADNLLAADLWTNNKTALVFGTSQSDSGTHDTFSLGNLNYDSTLSSNATITDANKGGYGTARCNNLVFAVETGTLLKKGTSDATQTAIYN